MAALLLMGAALTAWLTGGFLSDPTDRAAPPTTRANAQVSPGQERAAPASTRGGTASTGTTQPATSTTSKPATTRPPTTPTTTRQGQLPARWPAFTNRAGNNRVGVPPGFRVRTRQRYHAAIIEQQGGARRLFTVRSQDPSAPLPQASRDYRAYTGRQRPRHARLTIDLLTI